MKTRLGKIAQLPKSIRDQLNHRLENGQQGRQLLTWLNDLPETKELLAKFNYQPINKSNLSDWRHGGYVEWLQDQAREARIQRISESGASFQKAETGDLFENFARFAVAELMADLDSLQKFRGEKRSRVLHELIRDLARLQLGFNHSRRTELAWTKYNDSVLGKPGTAAVSAASGVNTTPSSTTPVKPDRAGSCSEKPHDAQPAPPERIDARPWMIRNPSHHQGCGCVCKQCHSQGSDYPYDEALADHNESKRLGTFKIWRGQTVVYIRPLTCNCPCPQHAPSAPRPAAPEAGTLALPRDPILAVRQDRHEPPASDEPHGANPSETINPAPAHAFPRSEFPVPRSPVLPYDSVGACLARISLLRTRTQSLANSSAT